MNKKKRGLVFIFTTNRDTADTRYTYYTPLYTVIATRFIPVTFRFEYNIFNAPLMYFFSI